MSSTCKDCVSTGFQQDSNFCYYTNELQNSANWYDLNLKCSDRVYNGILVIIKTLNYFKALVDFCKSRNILVNFWVIIIIIVFKWYHLKRKISFNYQNFN